MTRSSADPRGGAAALWLLLLLPACAAHAASPSPDAERSEVRAPIVRVSVRVAESQPPRVFADVISALPDGCTRFSRFSVRRAERTIFVDVFNTRPAGDDVACTMLYGEHESAVPLGSDFEPGQRYTLDVNGTRESFVAQ